MKRFIIYLPHNFDVNEYLLLNPDLQSFNQEEAKRHYFLHGRRENRHYKISLPRDFDVDMYISINSDLQNLTREEAKRHYFIYGKYENRCYKIYTGTIFHLSHNFGGGTAVYIENCKKIFNTYNHIVVTIIDNDSIRINDNNLPYKDLEKLINTSDILIVHSLLFDNRETNNNELSYNLLNLVRSVDCIKLFIAHDYFLLNPNKPNPLKSEMPKNIETNFVNNTLSIFDKVIFNSSNCYKNYLSYLNKIDNALLLNNIPDINFYKERIFPYKKEKYTIGLIGEIRCPHKGKFLANKIITMFNAKFGEKYHFVILGNYDIQHPNLTTTGRYKNEEIFSMIKNYDIDYFLFVSTFEETYSFTLSIALHTGLPIIFNDIGSYSERLVNYKNCFPFSEENFDYIIEIVNDIDNNEFIKRSEKNLSLYYPTIYNNMPEISNYLRVDNFLNFNIDEIEKNLHNGIVCFMHVCISDNFGMNVGQQIFNDQINYIRESGLYDKLDYIFVTVLGKNVFLTNDYKIKVIYYSENIDEQEFPNISRIKYFSDNISKNVKILRIHTKGVTNKPHAYEWRKYLEYYLIEKNELCLQELDKFKCVGVNHHYYYDDNKYKNHFSGNFWWANSSYIKNLEQLEVNEDRCVTEHWLIGRLDKYDYRHFLSLHQTPIDFYKTHLEDNKYNLELIKCDIWAKLETNFVKTRKIFGVYFICCIGDYLNIVKNQLDKLVESGLYNETDKIVCFVCKAENDCIELLQKYDKIKIISTTENLYEKYAINNFKNYISGEYYLYYMHSKSVTRSEACYNEWRTLCDYFIIHKWRLSVELLQYYDCVGTNLKNFPKKHYSGNFWWSKSEHINTLRDINDGYLSCEMYIFSNMKTNYVSIHQSYVNHGDTSYPENLYNCLNDNELIDKICIIPDFNSGDKHCIKFCGEVDTNFEPQIIELT
uniref:Glycosyl transferase family 1 domain-containing protein n=1 Tax=viral metagenome TaxID=1070528 RepID=A0A6C0LFW4_9ZZZZ